MVDGHRPRRLPNALEETRSGNPTRRMPISAEVEAATARAASRWARTRAGRPAAPTALMRMACAISALATKTRVCAASEPASCRGSFAYHFLDYEETPQRHRAVPPPRKLIRGPMAGRARDCSP